MAQHDYVIDNGSGQAVRLDINGALEAILTNNSGGTEPTSNTDTIDTPIAYMFWVDTNASPNLLKIRDSSNAAWITICEIASSGTGTMTGGQSFFSNGTQNLPSITFKNDPDSGMRRTDANKVSIVTNGSDQLTVDANGNVGIKTDTPEAELHIASDGNAVAQLTAGASSLCTIRFGDTGDTNIGKIQYDNNDNSLAFTTDTSTRLTIDSSGNLDVAGGNIVNGTPALGSSGYDLQNDGVHKLARDTTPANSVLKVMGASTADNGGEFRVKGDGDCENTNGNYDPISSDERLKENIVDASSQWEDIKGIRFRSFNYISNPNIRMLGCVAQELQQVCPSLIKTRPASEEEIADNSNTISQGDQVLSFKQIPLLLKAAKALQEAMERIETLEAKVAALEAGS